MVMKADKEKYSFAVSASPEIQKGKVTVSLRHTGGWKVKECVPDDIPVLPNAKGSFVTAELIPYADTPSRITVFPKEKDACLK